MDPNVEPSIKKELNKLLSARIIFHARNTQWIENLVPVRKRNGDIHLCVDFQYLKRDSKKYKYPVPPMEQILQKVFCSKMFSLLDGFSSYNKVLVSHSYQFKTSIKTPWGTFSYWKIPFGLINVGSTFKREMDVDFRVLLKKSLVFYLDDVTIFSKRRQDQVYHN